MDTSSLMEQILSSDNLNRAYLQVVRNKGAEGVDEMKLDVPRWAAFKIAYCGNKYARLAHNGWIHKAITTKRLTSFGLVSMLDYYTERCVTC